MKPLLLTAIGRTISAAPLGRRGDDVEVRRVPALPTAKSVDGERPTVIVLDRALLASAGDDASRLQELAAVSALVGLGDDGEAEPPADFPVELLTGYVAGDAPTGAVIAMLRGAFRHAAALVAARSARREADDRARELADLTAIGVALGTERELDTLLALILSHARRVTGSDAASLYLVERDEEGAAQALRFAQAQNHSLPGLPFASFTVPIDHTSLAGYVAFTGEPLVVGDVYLLPDDVSYRQNRSFDEKFGYRTKSMLVVPMKSHRDEIVGVLQLINRTKSPEARLASAEVVEREVQTYDARCVEVATALAAQAAVAIENGRLYEDIERLFEGFVTAAVTAIESRDPVTSGHSARVAAMTVGLAEVVDRASAEPFRAISFTREQLRELRYAGLLHDFGKVGVREQVLVKQKKLYPHDLALIRHRFEYLMQGADLELERGRSAHLLRHGREGYDATLAALEAARRREVERLRGYLDAIELANEPTVLQEGSFEPLRELTAQSFAAPDGTRRPLLEEEELRYLMIRKGNLDERERREIESHVTHTFRFLAQIPWTRELRAVPQIAYGHHEKLNGGGYPNALAGGAIPVQTRMMTIADIYDALTATDRPYKRAVDPVRALDILHAEAREGMLDGGLLALFTQAEVYRQLGTDTIDGAATLAHPL